MRDLQQLENIQQAFNLVVEHGRKLMQELYDEAKIKGKTVLGLSREQEFYEPRLLAFCVKYRKLLKLINNEATDANFDDAHLSVDLWSTITPIATYKQNQERWGFDECKFILGLCLRFSSKYEKTKGFFLTYTGCHQNLDNALDNAPIVCGIPEKVHGLHRKNLRLEHPEYTTLLNKIDLLRLYGCIKGCEIKVISNQLVGPGVKALDIAACLYETIETFLNKKSIFNESEVIKLHQETVQKIEQILAEARQALKYDPHATDTLGHITLACSEVMKTTISTGIISDLGNQRILNYKFDVLYAKIEASQFTCPELTRLLNHCKYIQAETNENYGRDPSNTPVMDTLFLLEDALDKKLTFEEFDERRKELLKDGIPWMVKLGVLITLLGIALVAAGLFLTYGVTVAASPVITGGLIGIGGGFMIGGPFCFFRGQQPPHISKLTKDLGLVLYTRDHSRGKYT